MFFDKRFIILITSGSYMGAKQALKTLSIFPSGGKIIGKQILYTAPELSVEKKLKQDRKFSKKNNSIILKFN